MAELDPNIPLNYLSGKYTQNYYVPNTFSDAFAAYDTARKNQQVFNELEQKKQAFSKVAQVRKDVESNFMSNRESTLTNSIKEELSKVDEELASIDNDLAELEKSKAGLNDMTGAYRQSVPGTPYVAPASKELGYTPVGDASKMQGYTPQERNL